MFARLQKAATRRFTPRPAARRGPAVLGAPRPGRLGAPTNPACRLHGVALRAPLCVWEALSAVQGEREVGRQAGGRWVQASERGREGRRAVRREGGRAGGREVGAGARVLRKKHALGGGGAAPCRAGPSARSAAGSAQRPPRVLRRRRDALARRGAGCRAYGRCEHTAAAGAVSSAAIDSDETWNPKQ